MQLLRAITFSLPLATAVTTSPRLQPFKEALTVRQASTNDALEVDMGYGVYRGSTNTATRINTWRGYAHLS